MYQSSLSSKIQKKNAHFYGCNYDGAMLMRNAKYFPLGMNGGKAGMGKELYTNIPSKVGDLIQDIKNGRIGLPDLQRPFVWKDNKVRELTSQSRFRSSS